jgi:uncharacterized protein (DUF2249 family)
MSSEFVAITPETRVGALLDAYPQLEDKLVAMAPSFAKLRNPVLRKTVAKVTTLRQAAKVGGVKLGTLINTLRAEIGQVDGTFEDESGSVGERPTWLDETRIVETMDGRPVIEAGERPLDSVMSALGRLSKGEILELTTPFEPAPLIDMAKKKGHQAWCKEESPEVFKTYFHITT